LHEGRHNGSDHRICLHSDDSVMLITPRRVAKAQVIRSNCCLMLPLQYDMWEIRLPTQPLSSGVYASVHLFHATFQERHRNGDRTKITLTRPLFS
jgi:hypothetical protein